MVQQISDDLSHPSTSTFQNKIRSAIIDAIRKLEVEGLWFNTDDFTLTAVVDQTEYESGATANHLPADWLYPFGTKIHMRWGGDANNVYILPVVSRTELRDIAAARGDHAQPPVAIAYEGGKLFMQPKPDAAHVFYGTYIKALTTPTKTYSSGWTFSADSTTSAWFEADKGEPSVRAKAKQIIARNHLKDEVLEGRMAREFDEAISVVRIRSNRTQKGGRIRGSFF